MSKPVKVGILFETDFYENEIFYYQHRFQEENIELHFLSRLWGNPSLTFKGHEYQIDLLIVETQFPGIIQDEAEHVVQILQLRRMS